ncbi:hypothetical protein C1929_02180 [Stenotrophomonas sp. ZAC14D1_NAIMI4_6]|uniref:hypothetical protein n=1 Tax=unclassified Stenotrophomonas maltophilia group TaxID=2961925 RepID=UPI000D53C4C5|nr:MULTISPECIES: hypothetical protein [unclassified Stenotrophomonas maltophilia group]AWH35646.1 hypothetical protein C1929_02180 [Stenotrophomonas sp. ZAC14D1_NAIMI4_6]AWH39776.1 hypothetical protein C1927_02185 [Stenotrophomonas sp. ZAC14D1_NAIMI4_1]
MTGSQWGLLAPETLPGARRTRTLGLGRSVRQFNELAVPGLGGVQYAKQVLFAALSMAVAKRVENPDVQVTHIDVANAIEAVACIIGYEDTNWESSIRMRGRNKLPRGGSSPDYRVACKRSFHVSQPMRMSTAQALPSLGLVDTQSTRFNAFECNDNLDTFVSNCLGGLKAGNSTVLQHLSSWVEGKQLKWGSAGLIEALHPLRPLRSPARAWLKNALLQGTALSPELRERRQRAWHWVARLHREPATVESLDQPMPPNELDPQHWHDLRAGAQLVVARDAAIEVLDAVERVLECRKGRSLPLSEPLPKPVLAALAALAEHAKVFLALEHHDAEANRFCAECVSPDAEALRHLLLRDEQVLRLVDGCARPGAAYTGQPPTAAVATEDDGDPEDAPAAADEPIPAGISYRIRNLYRLQRDLEDASQDATAHTTEEAVA